jgi:hypothetical protein
MHHYTTDFSMPRLTISLSEQRHRALKEAAARRNKSIAALIEESLEHYGIKTTETAAALVARSRRTAGLSEDEAREVAVDETRRARD